jgi:phenylacetic acid degradation operon negative regulatory protein
VNSNAQHRASPGIVFFALGLVSSVNDTTANAALVLAVAEELGLPRTACRAVILRLRRDGQLHSRRIGRSARYTVSPPVAAAQLRWTEHFRDGPPAWDGTFAGLLYDFPERHRSRRDRLRRHARLVGYGLLRPGLLISPDDRWPQLADAFSTDQRDGRILRITLTLSRSDTGPIACELWDLDQLAARYRRIARDTRRLLGTPPEGVDTDHPSAIARLYGATRPIYDAVADDPALPGELLPPGWPAPELAAALTDANATLGPAAVEQLSKLEARL